jgi:hypothetical protein
MVAFLENSFNVPKILVYPFLDENNGWTYQSSKYLKFDGDELGGNICRHR